MSAMRTYKMPIRSIRSAGMRDRLDWSRVALYRQMLRDGRRPPPVQLLHRLGDGRWQLGDGAHRMMAASRLSSSCSIVLAPMLGSNTFVA